MIGDFYAEDAAAPPTFATNSGNISNRPRTTATCEGDGVDFGNWSNGQDHTFTGDGTTTIADIIQELADDYDPSAIAILWIFTSAGTGQRRRAYTYDNNASLAPKLDIDHSPGSSPQTVTASPAVLTLAGVTPAVVATVTVAVIPAVLKLAGVTPTVQATITLSVTPAVVKLAGVTPAVSVGPVTVAAQAAVVTISGVAPTVSATVVLTASAALLSLVAATPAALLTTPVTAAVLTLSGVTPAVSVGPVTVAASPPAVLALTAVTPLTAVGQSIGAPAATLSLAALAPDVFAPPPVVANPPDEGHRSPPSGRSRGVRPVRPHQPWR